MNRQDIEEFVSYVKNNLKGDEKGQAQVFCDRLFCAFGQKGVFEAGGSLEARVKVNEGERDTTKFIDCLWSPAHRDGVLIEMKKKDVVNLESHFPQARDYWMNLVPSRDIGPGCRKPRYIVLCNFDKFIIYDECNKVDEVTLEELPERYSCLSFLEGKTPSFQNNTESISRDAANLIGELYQYLTIEKKENITRAQHFILQCVLALFSEDVELLPKDFFTQILQDCLDGTRDPYDEISGLFRQMASDKPARAGRFKDIRYFNGGLFKDVDPIELDRHSLEVLKEVANKDWTKINPSIFGALFEGTMRSNERHKYGAHFTSEVDMLHVITPTIIRPWKEKIIKAKTIEELLDLRRQMGEYRVLDPACGCGNFLFVAYREMKELECLLIDRLYEFPSFNKKKVFNFASVINTKQFFGLDIQPMAVEIAKMTMMIAKELCETTYQKRIAAHGSSFDFENALPLDNLDDNILCEDALLADWPEFDVVIGNPPYQSKNKMVEELGAAYVDRVRQKFPDVPGRADFCVYWFRKAHELMKEGQYAGLVGTNTIRQNYSRMGGLDYIVGNGGTLLDSVSTKVWSGDAAVYVSIATWKKGEERRKKVLTFQVGDSKDSPFEHYEMDEINSALSLSDVTKAQPLKCNKDSSACYQGQTQGNAHFLLTLEQAKRFLNDKKNAEVVHPFLIGDELLGQINSQPQRYVIDFRKAKDVFEVTSYKELYDHLRKNVYPVRKEKAEKEEKRNEDLRRVNPTARLNHHHKNFFDRWWTLSYARNELMDIIDNLDRYIVCSRVTKRPIFEFVSNGINPGDALQAFPLDDDYSFGILQSSVHWEWFVARCSTLKGDWRYTSDSVFDSFPWPQSPTVKQIEEVAKQAKALRDKRNEVMQKYNYTLRQLYRFMDDTPENPVSEIQARLDKAVREAYGVNMETDILQYLLNVNGRLYEREQRGESVQGPGLPNKVKDKSAVTSTDCVKMI